MSVIEKNSGTNKTGENLLNIIKKIIKDQKFYLIMIIILLSVISTAFNSNFMKFSNILTIFQQIAVLGIVTVMFTILMISGGIDLSIGTIMSLSAVVLSTFVITLQMNIFLSIFITFCVGIIGGALNGLIISKTKTVPLIITLGTSYVYSGLSLLISGGRFMSMEGKLEAFGRLKVLGIMPVSIFIMIAFVIVAYIILNKLRYGRRLVAIGGNEENAYLSGIKVDLYKISIYALTGLFGSVATILLVARVNSITASMGDGYTMQALAAAVIGGVTFEGGVGTILGAVIGCILMGLISNAMNIIGINAHIQTILLGVIIIVAVVISNINVIRKKS